MKNQYVYGAINRLEQAVNGSGAKANYLYNGLGHRVGKEITLDPTKQLSGQSQKPDSRIDYLIDLTREYHNLLEKTEDGISQTYFWDGNVAAFEESGKRSYYLQDELGSPLRIEDESGFTRETYGYGAFGENLYGNQGVLQVFGYTGYQRDNVAGTYYAQAREYQAEVGRFAEQDLIAGFMNMPLSMNRYSYCFNMPMILMDLDGRNPVGDFFGNIADTVVDFWNDNIVGTDTVYYETDVNGVKYEIKAHSGGDIFVNKQDIDGNSLGWSVNTSVSMPKINIRFSNSISGESWNPLTWETETAIKSEAKSGCYTETPCIFNKNGFNLRVREGGKMDTMPISLPNGKNLDPKLDASWSLSVTQNKMSWEDIAVAVSVVAACVVVAVFILDDGTIIGVANDGTIIPLGTYIANQGSMLVDKLVRLFTEFPQIGQTFERCLE